ncbi:MAG: CARDB domain-containing protein [Planctomycetales bacterium]
MNRRNFIRTSSTNWIGANWFGRIGIRRRARFTGSSSPVEALEAKVLPAVDLIVNAVDLKLFDPPPAGSNQYFVNITVHIQNLGTSPVDVTGVKDNLSDNVKVSVFGSKDTVWDNSDVKAISADFTPGGDNGSVILNQNGTSFEGRGFDYSANPNYNYLIFVVDPDNKVAESNGNNNTFVLDISKPILTGGSGILGAPVNEISPIDLNLDVKDLNSTDFNGGNLGVTIDGAQAKDKLLVKKVGTGPDKIHAAGTHLKIGSQTIGTITKVVPTADNNFQQSMQIQLTGTVSRDNLKRVLEAIALRPAKTSTGNRTAHFQIKDNTENFSNVTDRSIEIP